MPEILVKLHLMKFKLHLQSKIPVFIRRPEGPQENYDSDFKYLGQISFKIWDFGW